MLLSFSPFFFSFGSVFFLSRMGREEHEALLNVSKHLDLLYSLFFNVFSMSLFKQSHGLMAKRMQVQCVEGYPG